MKTTAVSIFVTLVLASMTYLVITSLRQEPVEPDVSVSCLDRVVEESEVKWDKNCSLLSREKGCKLPTQTALQLARERSEAEAACLE